MCRRRGGDEIQRVVGGRFRQQLRRQRGLLLRTQLRQFEAVFDQNVGRQSTQTAGIGDDAHAPTPDAGHLAHSGSQKKSVLQIFGADHAAFAQQRVGNVVVAGHAAGVGAGSFGSGGGTAGLDHDDRLGHPCHDAFEAMGLGQRLHVHAD